MFYCGRPHARIVVKIFDVNKLYNKCCSIQEKRV